MRPRWRRNFFRSATRNPNRWDIVNEDSCLRTYLEKRETLLVGGGSPACRDSRTWTCPRACPKLNWLKINSNETNLFSRHWKARIRTTKKEGEKLENKLEHFCSKSRFQTCKKRKSLQCTLRLNSKVVLLELVQASPEDWWGKESSKMNVGGASYCHGKG